ncbi:hypothetical protein ACJZ2D_009358 [Fusarium nematophilum]
MRPYLRSLLVSLLWGTGLVHSAINLDGSQAVEPASEDDLDVPSPIGDTNAYQVDQHDCPPPCVDYANTHSWIPYLSVERLARCEAPMLLQFSVSQPLDAKDSTILIRSCTIGDHPMAARMVDKTPMENPKKDDSLVNGGSLNVAPACIISGTPAEANLRIGQGDAAKSDGKDIVPLLKGMRTFFNDKENCDEKFLFAYYKQTVASIYIGAGLGKPTVNSTIDALVSHIDDSGSISNKTAVELCSSGRRSQQVVGVAIDTTGDLAAVQKTAMQWSKGVCAVQGGVKSAGLLQGVRVFNIAGEDAELANSRPTPTPTPKAAARGVKSRFLGLWERGNLEKRAVCKHIQVEDGDSCTSLSVRCGIRGAEFLKYNTQKDLCSTLAEGDYVCCSSGDPYKPPAPEPNADGTCKAHLIENGDTCDSLAKKNGVTVKDIENWNAKKTWAWTDCKGMLIGYNMCVGPGKAPMPPPQKGAECGPLVPGTKPPKDDETSLADLNPCPLKACCSNWGFCGVFPDHCKINAPKDGGPGTRKPGFQNTCVSNCNYEIKQNSGPPAEFGRIGYYEAYNLERDCLWLKAKDANTDGSYTHIHWAFASIDPNTWAPVIKQGNSQWADFKKLKAKRIVSLGGWADSAEPDKYHIIRSAIIQNRETFASNLVKFVKDEGIDGIDIDWEYPGAPDIMVGGKPIGQKSDGLNYLRFLTVLRDKMPSDKSVSIAAPASYWYLKQFPIDQIAKVTSYLVFMTYDLHGQWDYGNANAYDECPSGKCIRSHVNMTETKNSLSMITKAGVDNNKIFVGESSYGRSFHMAKDGCYGPMCEFTGSRTKSDAKPGRCTKTSGYLANAEINEILLSGKVSRSFYDKNSQSNVMLYEGDYVSYMTTETKNSRRDVWTNLNFAGSIDWAVDLQQFTTADFESIPERPKSGHGCIEGDELGLETDDLCTFSCAYGFCPESLCECLEEGPLRDLPKTTNRDKVEAYDVLSVDMNRLCKFACKYGYCPPDVCQIVNPRPGQEEEDEGVPGVITVPPDYDEDSVKNRDKNDKQCWIYKDHYMNEQQLEGCRKDCQETLDEAKEEGRTSNYGCILWAPESEGGREAIPWVRQPSTGKLITGGQCSCDNWLLNEVMDDFIEALPAIAQIGCYILMSSLKLVLDIGLSIFGGRALSAGVDMALTAAELTNYVYSKDEDPAGAFEWWLSPCGGSDLVPDEIKQVFDILSLAPAGKSSYKEPTKIKKHSGKKGDEGNPRGPPKPGTGSGGGGGPSNPKPSPPSKKNKCSVKPADKTKVIGPAKNTLQIQSCNKNDITATAQYVITTFTYEAKPTAIPVTKTCSAKWTQACYHYSSAIRENPHWKTLTCAQQAATVSRPHPNTKATSTWSGEHDASWEDEKHRKHAQCDRDEYPPGYLLDPAGDEWQDGGKTKKGQRVRYLPAHQNRGAGSMWRRACFVPPFIKLSETPQDYVDMCEASTIVRTVQFAQGNGERHIVEPTVKYRPTFTIDKYIFAGAPLRDDGLWDNKCWPSDIAKTDPGFTLLSIDEWYGKNKNAKKWDYKKPYNPPTNGD